MTTHCADGTSATGTATSAYGFFEPVKKNYFAKQPIEAPLKFSTGVNSSSGSLVLHRKDSSRLLRQPTLMASASAKNIETLPQNETKPLTFRSYLQKGTDPQPPLTKLSSFARQVEESRPAPNQPIPKMESEYGQEPSRKFADRTAGTPIRLAFTAQQPKTMTPFSQQAQSQQNSRVASPNHVLSFKKVSFKTLLPVDTNSSRETPLNNASQVTSKQLASDKKVTTPWDSQKQLSIYLAETSTSITSLVWKTHVEERQPQESLLSNTSVVFRAQGRKQHEPVVHAYTRRLSQSLTINDFTILKELGRGKFGRVSMVIHKATGFLCAMKAIGKETIRKENLAGQLAREIKIQLFLKHQNIASLHGYFDDETNVYLLLELCADGQLHDVLKQRKRLSEEEARPMIRQLCQAVDYMHRNSILHRDIKPENILMQHVFATVIQGVLKLCDFGWSVKMDESLRTTFCGTPIYVSPEILKGDKYDEKIDIWSIGVLTYEMLVGRIPFRIRTEQDLQKIVQPFLTQINDSIAFPEYVPLSADAKSFISSVLQKDPEHRLDLDALLNHPFLR